MGEYDWNVSLQLRYVLSVRSAFTMIITAYLGSEEALKLIEWYGRER